MQQGEGYEYFAARKMGRRLLNSPYDAHWWNTSKYRLCLRHFDRLPSDSSVLDLGCGLGQTAYFLAAQAGRVTGVDLSGFAIQFAKENYRRSNLRYVQADILSYEPEEPVDAVFCMDLVEHFEPAQAQRLLARIFAFLAAGGRLYAHIPIAESKAGARKLEKYKRKNPGHGPILDHTGDPTHKNTFSVPTFKMLLQDSGFTVKGEIRKIACWRPLRWLYRGLLALPAIPADWKDQATYSYIVLAQTGRRL